MKMKMKSTIVASSLLAAALPALSFADNAFTGVQAGLNLGYEDSSMDWETDSIITPATPGNSLAVGANDSESLDDSAFAYGVFTSYNMALNDRWIVGAELAYQGSNTSDSVKSIPGDPLAGNQTEAEVKINQTFLLGIKGGYLLNASTLAYSTLSATLTEVEVNSDCPSDGTVCNPGSPARSDSDDDNITGWALALGLEKSLSENLYVRAEYRYADLGTANVTAVKKENGEAFGIDADIDVTSQALLLAAVYKF